MLLLLPVAAVRGLLLVLTLLLFALVSAIATAGADETSQLAPWRRSIVLHSRILGRLVLVFLGFWVNVDGWDNYMQAQRCGVVRSVHPPLLCLTVHAARLACGQVTLNLEHTLARCAQCCRRRFLFG